MTHSMNNLWSRWPKRFSKAKTNQQLLYAHNIEVDEDSAGPVRSQYIGTEVQFSWVVGHKKNTPITGSGSLTNAAAALQKNLPVTLVLPASEGLLTKVDLPTKKHRQRSEALPFVLQSQVIGHVDALQLAWHSHSHKNSNSKTNELYVAGYPQQQLQALLNQAEQLGLQVQSVVLDAQLLPIHKHSWSLLVAQDYCLLVDGQGNSYRLKPVMVEAVQSQILATQSAPECIYIYGCEAGKHGAYDASVHESNVETICAPWLCDGVKDISKQLVTVAGSQNLASLLMGFYQADKTISLLPAPNLRHSLQSLWRIKNPQIVGWAGFCILALLGVLLMGNVDLEQRLERTKATKASISRPLQPQLGSVGNINQPLLHRLNELALLQSIQPNNELFELLNYWAQLQDAHTVLGSELQKELQKVNVLGVHFIDGSLTIYWQTNDVATSQQRLQQLVDNLNTANKLYKPHKVNRVNLTVPKADAHNILFNSTSEVDQNKVISVQLSLVGNLNGSEE